MLRWFLVFLGIASPLPKKKSSRYSNKTNRTYDDYSSSSSNSPTGSSSYSDD